MTALSTLQILAFCNFVAAIAFTPGPNNAIASMTGLNFGWKAAVPQALGVACGCAALFCVSAAGVGALVTALPGSSWVLALGGAAYLAWLGWGFLSAHESAVTARAVHPPRFHEAALFQGMNPKAWVASLGGSSAWLASGQVTLKGTILLAALFALICVPSVLAWAMAGAMFRGRLGGGGLRWFNRGAGVLLLLTAGWMVIENLDPT